MKKLEKSSSIKALQALLGLSASRQIAYSQTAPEISKEPIIHLVRDARLMYDELLKIPEGMVFVRSGIPDKDPPLLIYTKIG